MEESKNITRDEFEKKILELKKNHQLVVENLEEHKKIFNDALQKEREIKAQAAKDHKADILKYKVKNQQLEVKLQKTEEFTRESLEDIIREMKRQSISINAFTEALNSREDKNNPSEFIKLWGKVLKNHTNKLYSDKDK